MKAKALQFGKAMSAALFVLLLVVVGAKNALAQTQVATLQHGEDISVYYGANAFVEAHEAAQTGDIITLSSGTFTPTDITKAITLRGAGCAIDTVTDTQPTIFSNSINLNVTDTENFLTVEGIKFANYMNFGTLNNPQFNRCNFFSIGVSYSFSSPTMNNAQFVNCIIKTFYFNYVTNPIFINCVVWYPVSSQSGSTPLFYNSIMRTPSSAFSAINSIVCGYNLPSSVSSCTNCIGIYQYGNMFVNCNATGCITYSSYEEVFESFTGGSSLSFEESFALKDEIATGFLGTDGTQVGIYGGTMPYSTRPFYMAPARYNVSNKSNNEGKLNVGIEIITEGE